jgi:hypothetical protein
MPSGVQKHLAPGNFLETDAMLPYWLSGGKNTHFFVGRDAGLPVQIGQVVDFATAPDFQTDHSKEPLQRRSVVERPGAACRTAAHRGSSVQDAAGVPDGAVPLSRTRSISVEAKLL